MGNPNILAGKDLEASLLPMIEDSVRGVEKNIASFEGESLFESWLQLMRMQDELINIYYELYGEELEVVMNVPIGAGFLLFNDEFHKATEIVKIRFGEQVANRFSHIVSIYSQQNFTLDCIHRNYMNIRSIKDLLIYFQSRRLYFVTILHLIPIHAIGSQKVHVDELPNEFGAYIDLCLRSVTSGYQSIIASRCLEGYYAEPTALGLQYSQIYSHLEDFFLEPIMLSSLDIMEFDDKFDISSLKIRKRRYTLYSEDELQDAFKQELACFESYDIQDMPVVKKLEKLITIISPLFDDGYLIKLGTSEFEGLCKMLGLSLYAEKKDYFEILNSRAPFVRFGDTYYSTYFLLMRYIVNELYKLLRKNKRYQIKAGYLFEHKVSCLLEQYGYSWVTGVKRINHKEFDVICQKDGIIYNFQCKNNFIRVSDIDADIVNVVARYHKRLSHYYDKALKKEIDREDLLVGKLGIDRVENFVISRYPVMSPNPRVIPFNRLEAELIKGLNYLK